MRALTLGCLAAVATLLAAGCSSAGHAASAGGQARHDPLLGEPFYVEPDSQADQQASQLRAEDHFSEARALARIASEPAGKWFTEGGDVEREVRALSVRAADAGRNLLLIAYYIPARDCGGYSSGGASSPAAYRSWIDGYAAGIGPRRATVVLEPDAIPQALSGCLGVAGTRERYALLRYAVARLKRQPHTIVYVDAGNLGWIQPASKLAAPLRKAGIAKADGFALNVSNFYGTEQTIAYGTQLSHALGGAHFVIDTGRNGDGPYGAAHDELDWCNPPGRRLGTPPSTKTASALVDAYLWIKPPGTSDGSCRPGDPRAGAWWPEYALELVGLG